jgi:hypothetical protein
MFHLYFQFLNLKYLYPNFCKNIIYFYKIYNDTKILHEELEYFANIFLFYNSAITLLTLPKNNQ